MSEDLPQDPIILSTDQQGQEDQQQQVQAELNSIEGLESEAVNSPNVDTQELVERFNGLNGEELETAVTSHLQGIVDKSLADGADQELLDNRLGTEWLKFTGSGVAAEGETRTQPTFLGQIDYLSLQAKVLGSNQERIDQVESKIAETAEEVKRNMFSYQDVLTDDTAREQALDFTLSSKSAELYARAMAQELMAHGSEKIDKARASIRVEFDQIVSLLPENLKKEMSPFANSDSWINWDIAKQKYLSSHPPGTDAEYEDRATYIGMGIEQDPLDTETDKFSNTANYVQKSIAERHIGWEIQQMAQNGIDMSWLTSKNQTAADILSGEVKEDGQLHSWQYVELGRVTKDIAEYLANHPVDSVDLNRATTN
jgi:hypothetical protein